MFSLDILTKQDHCELIRLNREQSVPTIAIRRNANFGRRALNRDQVGDVVAAGQYAGNDCVVSNQHEVA